MSTIHIRRTHNLGLANAKTQVTALAEDLKKELHANYKWHDNQLRFERSGASGTIDVGEDFIEIDVKLGMALSLMKGKIEEAINRKLAAATSTGGGTKTA